MKDNTYSSDIQYLKKENNTPDSEMHSQTEIPLSDDIENLETVEYQTYSSNWDIINHIQRLTSDIDILREAYFKESNNNNKKTIKNVHIFISVLQSILLNWKKIREPVHLPALKFRWLEDNSALIEWMFKDFRIGFSIEPDEEESGWYLVSNDKLNEISQSGELQFNNLEPLLINLLSFALDYA